MRAEVVGPSLFVIMSFEHDLGPAEYLRRVAVPTRKAKCECMMYLRGDVHAMFVRVDVYDVVVDVCACTAF